MDEAAVRRDVGRPPPAPGDADRIEALERQVRQLTSRLAGWVEAQMVQALDDRRNEMTALRAELQVMLHEQSTGMRAESGSLLSAATRGLEVAQEQLAERLNTVSERAAELAAARDRSRTEIEALRAELFSTLKADTDAGPARVEAFEQRVKAAMGRLTDSVETRLTEALAERASGLDALRRDLVDRLETVRLEAAKAERTEVLEQQMKARTEELEQRVKAAVGRLAESVEERIGDQATAQQARFVQVHERVQAVELRQREAQEHLDEALEAIIERRRAEFDSFKEKLEETLASQLKGARTEIATAVAEAHRRFIVSVDQLHERMDVVADQATAAHAAATRIDTLQETVTSDGRRLEALEVHTRRTDARLTDVVDAKLSELATSRDAALERVQAQMRAALDAHLAETRGEVTLALAEGRQQLIDGAARLGELQATLDHQADEAVAGLDALGASVEVALGAAEGRLADSVQAKLIELEAIAAQVAASREEIDASVASVTRRVVRVQDQVQKKVAAVVEQMDALAAKAAKEAGTLAPLRSDLRHLQAQVAELADTVAELRPRRKTAAVPAKRDTGAPAKKDTGVSAKKVTGAPAKRAVGAPVTKKAAAAPAKKAAAPAKKAAAPAKKASRARRVQ